MQPFLIINPFAGNTHSIDTWNCHHIPILQNILGSFEFGFTQHRQHATELTSKALKNGFQTIIAIGGDGTINEVVNGFFENDQPIKPQATLGIIPFGSGGDFARTLQLKRTLKEAACDLIQARAKPIDVGRLSFDDPQYPERYFINIAESGLGSLVMQKVNAKSQKIPPLLRYLTGTLQGLAEYHDIVIKLICDDGPPHYAKLTNVVVANGRFFGRGMCPTPHAEIDDGFFDVVVIEERSRWKFLSALPYLYSRTRNPAWIKACRVKNVLIEVVDPTKTLLTEADGEVCGSGGVKFLLKEKAINILCRP